MTRILLAGDHSGYHCGSAAAFSVIKAEAARHGRLVGKNQVFDLLVVNGEGSMHHDSPGLQKKMAMLERALDQGKRAMLINTVWEANSPHHAQTLARCERVVARDIYSQRHLVEQGVEAEVALDLSYYAPVAEDASFHDFEGQVVFTDFWSREFDAFVSVNSKWVQDFPYIDMTEMSWSSLVKSLQSASALVTGRHHAVYAACRARIPFLFLPGNTHKIEGLVETAGVKIPACQSFKHLKRRVEERDFPIARCTELYNWMERQPRWTLDGQPPAETRAEPDLKSSEALAAVKRLRLERTRLDPFRESLPDLCGQRCMILGSAPQAAIPARSTFDRCVCINGSPYIAKRKGIHPALTVIVGFTTAMRRDISATSIGKLRGAGSEHTLFISAGDDLAHGRRVLGEAGFEHGPITEMTPLERAAIVGEVCGAELGLGKRDERISNGVFAVVLALWLGAKKVIVSGISLNGGHDYAAGTERHHVDGDLRCLQLLAKHFPQVQTTSYELSQATGVPLLRCRVERIRKLVRRFILRKR